MPKLLTLDSNVFISETKGNEKYSQVCSNIISRVGSDSLYLQTALDSYSTLVSLDEDDFVMRLKDKNLPIEIYHPRDFPY